MVTYASPGYLHRQGGRVASGLELPPGLTVLEPPALPGASRLAAVAGLNEWLMRRRLAAAAPPGGWDAVIFNDPRWSRLAGSLGARRRIFDCMDDLTATAPSAAWAGGMEARALAVADRVWTGTASLADRLQGRHARVTFIPCGVEAERFAAPDPAAVSAVRADLPPGEGPLAGYFGVLNERVDMARIQALLDSGPWRVLLIGPSTSRAPALPADPRLRSLGARPYAQLPAYLAHFDLALIPYDTQGPHRFLYPVKALEYLAGGKPVLSTPLPDVVRFLGDYVELADGAGEWNAAGKRLMADPAPAQARAERGRQYAQTRSWEAMVGEMENDLKEPWMVTQYPSTPPLLHVAHLLDGRHFGGAEQFVRRLIESAPAAGIDARAYCLSEGRLADFLRAQGLGVRVFASSGRFDFRALPDIARAARQDGLQILQAHTSRTHLVARMLSAYLRIPNITTIHSPIAQDENRSTGRHPLRAWVERLGRPWTDQIVSVSQEEAGRLQREERVAPGRIQWIPTGGYPPPPEARAAAQTELARWLAGRGVAERGLVIAMIAQMRPRKGPEVLLRAFARWRREGGRGTLLMIGDDEFTGGGYLARLQALARESGTAGVAGAPDAVFFPGFMAEPWRLAGGADLVALPSLFGEGMPLVLLEAMSYGIPIVVSDTPGNRELAAGGRHGWTHPAGDDAALARTLAQAAADAAAREARGAAAHRHFLEHHTLERIQDAYRRLYETLTGRR